MSMTNFKRFNEDFIELLDELSKLMMKKGEPFRSRAYKKAEESIIQYNNDIYDIAQLKNITGIGTTILTKLEEYINTGNISVLEQERNDPANILAGIFGIGPIKAKELVGLGITTIEQLKQEPGLALLNEKQKLGLKYYEDIQKRIQHQEIIEFRELFKVLFDNCAPKTSDFEIVGSFRRGAKTSGDIDIIITNKNNNKETFDIVLDVLINNKIIIEVLSRGKTKSLTLAQIKKDGLARRVDFLYTPPNEYAFALFYFTGSKLFNTIVRQKAVELGYTLNEHGISYMNKGIKGNKIDKYFPTEESILNFLGFVYVKPEDRIDSRALTSFKQSIPEDILEEPTKRDDSPLNLKKEKTIKNKTLKKPTTIFPNLTELVNLFKEQGISILKTMTENQLTDIITFANTKYYDDDQPVLTDCTYDIIREYILEKFPENQEAKAGHTKCIIENIKTKVKLPYEMWSMDKNKPNTEVISKWCKKYTGRYIVSAKLDGISALYVCKDGEEPKLYTRGNGIYGQDISPLIPYLIRENLNGSIVIRGEIIISKKLFAEKYAVSFGNSKTFANSRNFVAGIVNRKTIDANIIKDLDFVPYEVIQPELKPSEQMNFLNTLWNLPNTPQTVKYHDFDKISNETLSKLLLDWRETYQYEIDGIIVVNDNIYSRPKSNPEYAFAFKMVITEQIAEVKVVDIIWTPSKYGYIIPRVQIEPIRLGGVKIEYATGFNAKFIQENKIGVGALICIIRSGDVIPHIIKTVIPADNPLMPIQEYEWDSTHTNIILIDKNNETVKQKNIAAFFKTIEVDGLGFGNIKKIIDSGFDTVPKILAMSKDDFIKVPGFKTKITEKLYNGIRDKLKDATLYQLLTASNCFGRGFGDKRFESYLHMYPDILITKETDEQKIAKLITIEGIAKKTAEKFVKHIPDFITFMKEAKLDDKLTNYQTVSTYIDITNPLYDKKIVITGFRNKELIQKLKDLGADNTSTINKNTFALIVKDDININTGKTEEAKKLDIPIITYQDFINKYF
jgi:NAD-dependent DNA ligase/predicted flap endonuclease-1-like 5' DNA nuclease